MKYLEVNCAKSDTEILHMTDKHIRKVGGHIKKDEHHSTYHC